jgi:hypothetical protein
LKKQRTQFASLGENLNGRVQVTLLRKPWSFS